MEDKKKVIDITEEEKLKQAEEQKAQEEQQRAMELVADKFIRGRVYVYLAKNNDYGDSFTVSMNEFGDVAFRVRAKDKLLRLKSLAVRKQLVADESTKDSVLDLFNYTAMFLAYKEEKTRLVDIIEVMYKLMNGNFEALFDTLVEQQLINPNVEEDKPLIALVGNTLANAIMQS